MKAIVRLLFVLVGILIGLAVALGIWHFQKEKKSDFSAVWTGVELWAVQETDLESRNAEETREEKLKKTDLSHLTQQEADALVYAYFPTCDSLYEYHEPLKISKHVQNCTQKAKKWSYPDGLGGACFPWYMMDKKHGLLRIDTCGNIFEEGKLLEHKYRCKVIGEWWGFSFWTPVSDDDEIYTLMSGARQALNKGLVLWFLDSVSPRYDMGQMRILRNDPDTEIISERWAWSDEKGNYFVAGSPAYWDQIYFVINDKFYDPTVIGANLDGNFFEGETLSSNWLFGGFRGSVPLVKRILNYKKSSENLTGEDSLAADYILETCELRI